MTPILAPSLSEPEQARIAHLVDLLGTNLGKVLEVGARDGRVTFSLAPLARNMVALDLDPQAIPIEGPVLLAGDVCALPFSNASFDTVVCTEVLEHIPPDLFPHACRELIRVTRERLLVTVPFDQDLSVAATRCGECDQVNPPWGHRLSFTVESLLTAFPSMEPLHVGTFGTNRNIQPRLSGWIEARLGYPHGAWHQEEPCIFCGARLVQPDFPWWKRSLALLPRTLTKAARTISPDRPTWIAALLQARETKTKQWTPSDRPSGAVAQRTANCSGGRGNPVIRIG